MSEHTSDPSLAFTLPLQLTKTVHRQVYDEISAGNPKNSAKGKIVVVTGGGTGIGAAAAHVWARAGAAGVVITGRTQDALDKTVESIEKTISGSSTKVLGIRTDVKLESDTNALFEQTKQIFGRTADVVIANAAIVTDTKPLAEENVGTWWSTYETNVLGTHNTVVSFIKSQPDPKSPVGTIIYVSSGITGTTLPGLSGYATSKLAGNRYMEYVGADYPTLRTFTLLPGIVLTRMSPSWVESYARDEAELTGSLALYLSTSRADYLKSSVVSVNWDVSEMEARKQDIVDGEMLKIKWIPALPCGGGSGLE